MSKTATSIHLAPSANSDSNLGDRFAFIGFISGALFLACLVGIILSIFKAPPYRWTQEAISAVAALNTQQKMLNDKFPKFLWKPARYSSTGVEILDSTQCQPGLTLYSAANESAVVLMNQEGEQVHKWTAPFSQVWPSPSLQKSLLPDDRVYIRAAHVEANGDLLAVFETTQSTPNGVGMAKLDRDSNVLWSYDGNCHHDFDVDDQGNIYVLTHDCLRGQFPKTMFNNKTNIEDSLTILAPDGSETKKFSLLKMLVESPYYLVSLVRRDAKGDVLHGNTINMVTPGFAKHYDGVEAGQVIVCFRNYNLVVIVDPETEKIVWAANGPWFFPHDPDPLDNGNLLVFDNASIQGTSIRSRVIEFDPREQKIEWQYSGTDQDPLMSEIRSMSQRLQNGNVLICESNGSRILEVTPHGEKVWQFVTSARGGKKNELAPILGIARRYNVEDLPFVQRSLTKPVSFQKPTH